MTQHIAPQPARSWRRATAGSPGHTRNFAKFLQTFGMSLDPAGYVNILCLLAERQRVENIRAACLIHGKLITNLDEPSSGAYPQKVEVLLLVTSAAKCIPVKGCSIFVYQSQICRSCVEPLSNRGHRAAAGRVVPGESPTQSEVSIRRESARMMVGTDNAAIYPGAPAEPWRKILLTR